MEKQEENREKRNSYLAGLGSQTRNGSLNWLKERKQNQNYKEVFLMTKKNIMPALLLMSVMFLSVMFVSAAECSGQSCAADVSATVGNSAPVISAVISNEAAAVTLSGGTTVDINVTFRATDSNGYLDLDHSSASVSLNMSGETTRTSSVCNAVTNASTYTDFNCVVTFQFYDGAGSWTVNASVSDDAAAYDDDVTVSTTVNALDYVDQAGSTAVGWASVAAGTNDNEADNSLTVTNYGNQDYSAFSITAFNITNGDTITAESFKVHNATGLSAGFVSMVDSTPTNVFSVLPGLNDHGAAITEEVFFYLDVDAGLATGAYTGTNWAMAFT